MVTYQGFVTSGLAMDANNLNALLLQADVIASRPAAQSLANISFIATDTGSLQIEDGVGGWTELGKIAYSSGGNSFLRPSGDRLMVDLAGGAPAADPNVVHIWKGSAGGVSSNTNAILTLEDTGYVYIQFLTPNTVSPAILFGDPQNSDAGVIQYLHAVDRFDIRTDAVLRLSYSAGAFAFQEATKISATGLLELETSSGDILLDPAGDVITSTNLIPDSDSAHDLGSESAKWDIVHHNAPSCSVFKSGEQTITTATDTIVSFDQEHHDTDAMHDNVTNNSRITLNKAGIYIIHAIANWNNAGATPSYSANIKLNGSSIIATGDTLPQSTGGAHGTPVMAIRRFSAADYVELEVRQDSGSNKNITTITIMEAIRIAD